MLRLVSDNIDKDTPTVGRTKGALQKIPRAKPPIDPVAARRAVAAHLTQRSRQSAVNLVQFVAQQHEVECVELLVQFARDETLPPALRRDCAKDILLYARGQPKVWLHDGRTVDPAAPSPRDPERRTVGDDIADVCTATALYQQFNLLVSQGVHPDEWSDAVKLLAGESLAHYAKLPDGYENLN